MSSEDGELTAKIIERFKGLRIENCNLKNITFRHCDEIRVSVSQGGRYEHCNFGRFDYCGLSTFINCDFCEVEKGDGSKFKACYSLDALKVLHGVFINCDSSRFKDCLRPTFKSCRYGNFNSCYYGKYEGCDWPEFRDSWPMPRMVKGRVTAGAWLTAVLNEGFDRHLDVIRGFFFKHA